jgi:hypothetical protein
MKNKLRYLVYFAIVAILVILVGYQNMIIKNYSCSEIGLEGGGDIYKAELLDSINILRIDLERYEVTLENLKQEDSIAAKKFEDILYALK